VNLDLDDPFTRAVVETVAVAAATLILLFIVAEVFQSILGLFIAVIVALIGFGFVGHRAKQLVEDYV
jgi:hypothetical protein